MLCCLQVSHVILLDEHNWPCQSDNKQMKWQWIVLRLWVAWLWSCCNRVFTKARLRGTGHCKFSWGSCHCWLQLARQFQVAIGSCQDVVTQIIHFTVYIEKEPGHFFSVQQQCRLQKHFMRTLALWRPKSLNNDSILIVMLGTPVSSNIKTSSRFNYCRSKVNKILWTLYLYHLANTDHTCFMSLAWSKSCWILTTILQRRWLSCLCLLCLMDLWMSFLPGCVRHPCTCVVFREHRTSLQTIKFWVQCLLQIVSQHFDPVLLWRAQSRQAEWSLAPFEHRWQSKCTSWLLWGFGEFLCDPCTQCEAFVQKTVSEGIEVELTMCCIDAAILIQLLCHKVCRSCKKRGIQ